MGDKTVFYAWQAQHPGKCNRYLVEEALDRALKDLARDKDEPVVFTLDQDARGAVGSPEISATILQKIEGCAMFIADITPVGTLINGKRTPNPNVVFELGYAWHTLGENRIILVLNEAFGSPEDLPFDISKRSLVRYRLDAASDRSHEVRDSLAGHLRSLVSAIAHDDHLRFLRERGLSPTDIALFKAVYAKMLEADGDICDYDVLLQAGSELGLNEETVDDATQMISDAGFWEASEVMGPHRFSHVRAVAFGMEEYCKASVAGYQKLPTIIARHIANGVLESSELAKEVERPVIVIEHVLQLLQDDDYIRTVKSNVGVHVFEVKPKLKRLFAGS